MNVTVAFLGFPEKDAANIFPDLFTNTVVGNPFNFTLSVANINPLTEVVTVECNELPG